MEDTDLIARVYAYPDEYIHNALAAITATGQSIAPEPPESPEPDEIDQSRSHRESTEPPIEPDTDWRDKYPFLELRFSHGARLPMGLVFGTDKGTCDIVLPHKGGISRRHFALTYKRCKDTYYHLVVRDLNSTSGTEVDYNGKGLGVRKNFDWIMHGYQFPDQARKIAIKLSTALKFIIIVPRHDITSSTYVANVERFLQGSAAPEDLVGTLGIYTGLQTEQDTLAHTPTTGPIIIPYKELGGGGFGLVSRCWNVSTGDEWACKQPRQANLDQRELQEWAKEIGIMKTISHEHIVRFHAGYLEPNPIIYMEYVPLGNLQDAYQQSPFSIPEVFEILHQSASALAYLHERSDPICHRDIKPENILVQSRHPLYIKLSDFGLSKAGDLKTMCGTQNYMAPEVVASCGVYAYTTAADIWSLGVIILQFTDGCIEQGSGRIFCGSQVKPGRLTRRPYASSRCTSSTGNSTSSTGNSTSSTGNSTSSTGNTTPRGISILRY
ncbi:kinase-like protein [Hypoxylon argillaceum]|nr:kinase-like protein [Hypoxylon argillaceum]